jgi:hypothetical protein
MYKLLKTLLGLIFISVPLTVYSKEVLPEKNKLGKDIYVLKLDHAILKVTNNPFTIIRNNTENLINEDESKLFYIEKVFHQGNKAFIVTNQFFYDGMRGITSNYRIDEINSDGRLLDPHEVKFEYIDSEDLFIIETKAGIKIHTKPSKVTGKKYIYELRNGQIYDYSTAVDDNVINKESIRVCNGFYKVFIEYEYEYNPNQRIDSIYDIGTANYGWASHKVKSTPRLEERFISLLKAKTPEERKRTSYEDFKKEYCD